MTVQGIHQNSEITFVRNYLVQNVFEAVFATFCCYDHGVKASEAVQKIAIDQKSIAKAPRGL